MATKKSICKRDINEETGIVTFNFANGKTLICDPSVLPETMQNRLRLHGTNAKVGDSFASAQTVDEAIIMAENTWANLQEETWNVGRQTTGGIIIEALAEATGKTKEECLAVFQALPEDKQKELAKNPQIAAICARIRLERAEEKAAKATGQQDLGALFSAEPESDQE